ncbi:peptidoglycan-associated lipoprotein Pal [Brevundimonas sp.]|uniref:peptidoglycan-associated lipoprotein Pal n=1 Tax=Brevundimonas sp. TaxID=1871086 RepID=UPI0025DFE7C0|nr:peptidoglycan-associated lipoprotein Pal [Brevundimonas sp.]
MTKTALRTTAIAAMAILAAAACTRREQPQPVDPPPPGPTQPTNPGSGPTTPPVTGGPTTSVTPGSQRDFVVNVGDRVYFDFDSYSIRSDAQRVLAAQAAWLARYPQVQVRIEGNADERGTREYNLALGARRAEAVRSFLIANGVSAARIDTISYGKERPIAMGSNEEAWAQNRNAHTAITGGAPAQ